MGDKKSEYEEALEKLDADEQPLAYIEGTLEDAGSGVLIATSKRLVWYDRMLFGMKTFKTYEYSHYADVKWESESDGDEIEFKPRAQGFMGTGTKAELEVEHIKSDDDQQKAFIEVVKQKLSEASAG
jgi:hypothetical protein